MIMQDRSENMRRLIEMALTYGRKKQSPQTGYLHYCYKPSEKEPHLPIPIVENFLFALTLLRSRNMENVAEAKTLLEGLLHFQNQQSSDIAVGNFPIYLHEFPFCKDRFIGIQVASIIFWILKAYHLGLGHDLKMRLETALRNAIKHALQAHAEKPAHYATAVKIAATAKAGGELLHDKKMTDQGQVLLDQLCHHPDYAAWYSPKSIGVMLTALMMVYPALKGSSWNHFWEHLIRTWHRHTCTYVGPSLKEWQQGYEPQVTLYDLLLGYYSGEFSGRALKDSPAHLEAALIPPFEDDFEIPIYPLLLEGTMGDSKWTVYHGKSIAYSMIQGTPIEFHSGAEQGFHPFRLVWGNRERVHTFVCQGGNGRLIDFIDSSGDLKMVFELGEFIEFEDREKSRQIIFYGDIQEQVEFLVAGNKSSTFKLGEVLTIQDESLLLSLTFTQEHGEGRFFGHRMLGNRPSQLDVKKNQYLDVYDWQVFLRTVGCSPKSQIIVTLQIE